MSIRLGRLGFTPDPGKPLITVPTTRPAGAKTEGTHPVEGKYFDRYAQAAADRAAARSATKRQRMGNPSYVGEAREAKALKRIVKP